MLINFLAVLFALLFVGGVILFVVFLVVLLPGYSCCCEGARVKFKFKDFKRLYDVMPEKFHLCDDYVWFHNDCIGFKFWGYTRYCLFHYFEEKRDTKIKTNEEYERILQNAQHDIEQKQKQIHQETIDGLRKIRQKISSK